MGFKERHTKYITTNDDVFLSNISGLTNACDCLDNLQISIYLIEEDKFIYSNCALEKILGKNCKKLLNVGWDYWYSLVSRKEALIVKNKIKIFFSNPYFQDPFILKYHIVNESGKKISIRHEILLHSIGNQILAINYFFDISEREKIEKYVMMNTNKVANTSHTKITLISPREKEVLKLVADGFSSKQIADRLFISNHTAISHRKNLIEKFKVKNTAQLINKASRTIEF